MRNYLLGILAVIMAFAFTTKENQTLFDYYYTEDGDNWVGVNSIQAAKTETGCDFQRDIDCAFVYPREHLTMVGETVTGVAEESPGIPFEATAVLQDFDNR